MERYFDKKWSKPAFFISLIAFVLFVLVTFPLLPDQIISNSFNLMGSGANSPRFTLLLVELIFSLIYLLVGYGCADVLIKFNPEFINIPNKKFWIDPSRVELTLKKVSGFFYWILFITNIYPIHIFFIETQFDKECQFMKIFLAKRARLWH